MKRTRPFDFSRAKIALKKQGRPVHVIVGLLALRDKQEELTEDRAVLDRAIDYIKALEQDIETSDATLRAGA